MHAARNGSAVETCHSPKVYQFQPLKLVIHPRFISLSAFNNLDWWEMIEQRSNAEVEIFDFSADVAN